MRKCRNDFAHGLWTISDELPDALLWDPAETRALIWECNVKQQAVPIFAETMVYSRSDLIREARDAQQAAGAVHSLSVLFDPRYQNQYQKRLKALLASPLVVRLGPVEGFGNVPSTTPATGLSGHRRASTGFDVQRNCWLFGFRDSVDFGWIQWVLAPVLAPRKQCER